MTYIPLNQIGIKILSSLVFAIIILTSSVSAQKGIRLNTPDAFDGYTLCSNGSNRTYLLDNCGEIVNFWSNTLPRYYARLTPEGELIYINNNRIIIKNWDDTQTKNIFINSNNLLLDYEVMKLENGNYLAACRRLRNSTYFSNLGWDPSKPTPDRTDGVVEIDPSGNIVWEWNIGDHTIQDKNASFPNYGNISIHPERVDINAISNFDWQFGESFMINGIDYNQELDQILISVRKVSEVMIIDHSTTTEEASGSTGGNSGMGGDILYRWGNPQNYGYGIDDDRILYYQHNPNWIKYGEHKGKIIMYNNGLDRFVPGEGTFSSVHIFEPPMDNNGNYIREIGNAFQPLTAEITIDQVSTGNSFYSGYTSGAQVLPNGNIYITVGLPADFIEVKPNGEEVWNYSLTNSSYIFRSEKYPKDYPAFEGKDLMPNGTVENPSSTYNCELFTSTDNVEVPNTFTIKYYGAADVLEVTTLENQDNILEIRNIQGRLIQSFTDIKEGFQLSMSNYIPSIYFVSIFDKKTLQRSTRKIVIF